MHFFCGNACAGGVILYHSGSYVGLSFYFYFLFIYFLVLFSMIQNWYRAFSGSGQILQMAMDSSFTMTL